MDLLSNMSKKRTDKCHGGRKDIQSVRSITDLICRKGSVLVTSCSSVCKNSSGSFSSLVRPFVVPSLSRLSLRSITLSALTKP